MHIVPKSEEVLDFRHLVLLTTAIAECGDLACAAAITEISMEAIIRKCQQDEDFRFKLVNSIGQYHYRLRARITNLALKSRKRYVYDDATGTNLVEYIPNENMVKLAAQLAIFDVQKLASEIYKNDDDFSSHLPESANIGKPTEEDNGNVVNLYELDPSERKRLAQKVRDAKRDNR